MIQTTQDAQISSMAEDTQALRDKFDFVLQKHLRKMEVIADKEKILEHDYEAQQKAAKMKIIKKFINKIS